jgi:excisionase family DNA binding protein
LLRPTEGDIVSVLAADLAGGAVTEPSPLLEPAEAAALLRVPKSWVMAEARAGRIPHRRLGKYVRFHRDDLLEWSEQQRRGPAVATNGAAGR